MNALCETTYCLLQGIEQQPNNSTSPGPESHNGDDNEQGSDQENGGVKKFKCSREGCGKSYTSQSNLLRHQQNHDPLKFYKCSHEGCGKSYSIRKSLLRHQQNHDPLKFHKCPHEGCEKRYFRGEHLDRHMLNHNATQIFKCPFPACIRTFVRNDLCKRHEERHKKDGFQLPGPFTTRNKIVAAVLQGRASQQIPQLSIMQTGDAPYPGNHIQFPASTLQSENSTPLNQSLYSDNDQASATAIELKDFTFEFNDIQASNFMGDATAIELNEFTSLDTTFEFNSIQASSFRDNSTAATAIEQQLNLSEDHRQEILHLIDNSFNNTSQLLTSNREDSRHVLSLHMMQTSIALYWLHFYPQIPILHKPTFITNDCPKLLILVIVMLGSTCVKSYRDKVALSCAELARHIRVEIFKKPPAELWVFQTLLLLELFEKMYSTRSLHESAHVHHATLLQMMMRGNWLFERRSTDESVQWRWDQWITDEARRRVVFAAFAMDSIHATMFGHSSIIVVQDIRLLLPCDEALWNAASSAEFSQILYSNNLGPATSFLISLQETLRGQPVRTNSFGRTILMASLLSASWHMKQRDFQVSALGVTKASDRWNKWRESLPGAFHFWNSQCADDDTINANENAHKIRTLLYHLAHMAMNVDVIDCQMFAGANHLLNRNITPHDYETARRRMKELWAPTARARVATFYALRLLSSVLISEDSAGKLSGFYYSAKDDFLLNRPWVLYFATLIVWSYGYALDGPIKPIYTLSSQEEFFNDMQGFLRRVGGVRAPDDLSTMGHRNACLGLLVLMRNTFAEARWELLHEASKLLNNCIEMLTSTTTRRDISTYPAYM